MTEHVIEAVIFVAAMLALTIAILAALYCIVRDAPPQPPTGRNEK
jgi:hypothetical protein